MVLASIIDITERKIQERSLKTQVELEIRNKDLEQFAYLASHDLQEPLRTVSNYMQLFAEDYIEQLDDNAKKYLTSVNNATSRMSVLIKSLLDFSRLGRDKKLITLNCKKIIDEVLADLEIRIKTSQASIEVTEMPEILAYESELRQLFQNLINNAIKFQRPNLKPKIKISATEVDHKWKFAVSDNGIGIAPEHFERVFGIFQRLHTKDEFEGNGIGLANCKKIVELHNGEIWLDSKLGEGTTFYFTLNLQ
jgi:light-regulated signal transduction histidine kinase (bacteriophytochrome)